MHRVDHRSQDADIDIGRLFAAIWRDKLRIVFGTIVFTGLTFAFLSLATPEYRGDARVLIEASESVFTRPDRLQNNAPDASLLDQEGVASQAEIMMSSDVLMKVANDLNLAGNDEFGTSSDISAFQSGLIALGLASDPSLIPAEKRVLDNIHDRLNVYPVPESRVIVVDFRSRSRELAARFPNALAEAYLALESSVELDSTGRAASYLADEIEALQKSVREAEEAVVEFRSSSDLLLVQNEAVLANQQLAELSTELSRVRAERSSAEARATTVQAALENGASINSLPEVVASALINRLREREITLKSNIADLSTTLLPSHPRIRGLRSQLQDLSTQIDAEARKVLRGLQNQAEIARSREDELIRDLNEQKVVSANASGQQVELRALEREADAQRALLESYLVRFREARSRGDGQYAPAKARLISRAIVPSEPVFPKMIPMTGAAFFVSLLLMMLATLMRELFSGRAFVPAADDQPVTVPMPAPAAAPPAADPPADEKLSVAQEHSAAGEPRDRASNDNFGVPALAGLLAESGADRVIIVSPEGDAGAAAAVGVVRALADAGLRAILVDLTGAGAASRRMMEDPDSPGITDLLAASSSYSDVIYADFATNAHLIPTGIADPARAMRAVERLPIIIDALISAYDIVVVECGRTNAENLRRLVGEETQIVLSVVDPSAAEIVEAASDLVAGGYDDLKIVTADAEGHEPGGPQPRRSYAR